MRTTVLWLGLVALSGCASTGEVNQYTADYDRLVASCRDRGGILAPTGGQSGRPENDNVCKITGQPSPRVGG